tara:strand:+ start:186 stop:533 length:348 start_codon:yes stop_codon:yes gene_type:complete
MWQEILKQKADFAGFFRDFEKNKIAELAKKGGEGWDAITKIGKKYGLSDGATHLIWASNNPNESKAEKYIVPIVDIPSYNKVVRKEIELKQKARMKSKAERFKTNRRKGQRKRRR